MLLEGDDGFSFSRDSSNPIHPNLTLPDPSPLNRQIHKVRQEAEELLNKINHKLSPPDGGNADGKTRVCLQSCAFPLLPDTPGWLCELLNIAVKL